MIHCIKIKAVETLLISDHLFRTKDFKKRRMYNDISEDVKRFGGKTVVFSSLHPSGEKLKNISGIAALLRFEVQSIDEEEENEEEAKKVMEEVGKEEENLKVDMGKLNIVDEDDSGEGSYD